MTYSLTDAIASSITLVQNNQVPFIRGGIGIGKTSRVKKEIAEAWKRHTNAKDVKVIYFPCGVVERGDITIYALKDGELVPFVTNALPKLEKNVAYVILFDDYTKSDDSIDAPVASLVLERTLFGTDYTLNDNCCIVFTGNPLKSRAGDRELPSSLLNRIVTIDVEIKKDDFTSWKQWAFQNGVHSTVIAYLNNFWATRFVQDKDETGASATPRSFASVGKIFDQLTNQTFLPIVGGLIGKGTAVELQAFSKLVADLPDFQSIFDSPKTATPLTKVESLYLTIQAFVTRINTNDEIESAIIYLKETCSSNEFATSFVRDLLLARPDLVESEAISRFKTENASFKV